MEFDNSTLVPPCDDDAVLHQVCCHISELLECAQDEIRPDDNLFTELGMDSLSILSLFIGLKRTFRVAEPASPEEYQLLSTPRKVARYVVVTMRGDTT